jgi:phytoene synthase
MRAKRDGAAEPAAHVVEPGSARYFAWLYAGDERRELVRALFEIEHEIEASLRPGLEHHVAHVRLAWWREECERFARGAPVHPATRRLRELMPAGEAAIELHGLVECAAWDLAAAPPEKRDELERHCGRWARAMILPLVRASASEKAHALGTALRETELLLRLAPDARRGWLRLPLDELDSLGIEPRALADPPWPRALAAHLQRRFETLRHSLECALASIDQSMLHVWSAVVSASAMRAMSALPDARRDRRLDGIFNALHAWRAARGALRGSARLP